MLRGDGDGLAVVLSRDRRTRFPEFRGESPPFPRRSTTALEGGIPQAGDGDQRSQKGEDEHIRRLRHRPEDDGTDHRRYGCDDGERPRWRCLRAARQPDSSRSARRDGCRVRPGWERSIGIVWRGHPHS